jgi:hypothetical protein
MILQETAGTLATVAIVEPLYFMTSMRPAVAADSLSVGEDIAVMICRQRLRGHRRAALEV